MFRSSTYQSLENLKTLREGNTIIRTNPTTLFMLFMIVVLKASRVEMQQLLYPAHQGEPSYVEHFEKSFFYVCGQSQLQWLCLVLVWFTILQA